MPLQNRVTPLGELVAVPARGLVYGNRGCLHDAQGRIRRRFDGRRWIACRLRFRGWRRAALLQPGRFTELFFLDEATAFAAGHRPCALCRREDFRRFSALWRGHHAGEASADAIDARLHDERVDAATGERRCHPARLGDLPDGALVLRRDTPQLLLGGRLWAWTPAGYRAAQDARAGERVRSSRRRRWSPCWRRDGTAPCRSCTRPCACSRRRRAGTLRPWSRSGPAAGSSA